MSQPRISRLDTWARMEARIHKVLNEALSLLNNEAELPEPETLITRKLYFCLIKADRQLKRHSDNWITLPLPMCEANNQPLSEDIEKLPREDKRPDIQYGFYDEEEEDDLLSARQYVIECKRLGKKTKSNWKLNENYILFGTKRFVAEDHAYGKGTRSGAMIGYVQNMDFDDILTEVNTTASTHLGSHSVPLIALSNFGWQIDAVSYLESQLTRSFPVTPFMLHHFWVDLRKHYGTRAATGGMSSSLMEADSEGRAEE